MMDKDDFGYTKRDPWILERFTSTPAEENTLNDERRRQEELNISRKLSHPKSGAVVYSTVGTPTTTATTTTGGVVVNEGTTSSSQETGSSQVNTHQRPETSVIRDPPNIPNVVEYHLKLPCSEQKNPVTTGKINKNGGNFELSTNEMRTTEELTMTTTPPTSATTPLSSRDDKKNLISRLTNLSIDNNVFDGSDELPQVFQVKYLGSHDARGLWGIKHTRKPVDSMVATAKSLPTDAILPLMKLIVSQEGVTLLPFIKQHKSESPASGKNYPIEIISYGVQDLVYTRVFSMIVVRDTSNFRKVSPFECHAFVCESKYHARQLTYALATAFQIYSQIVKDNNVENKILTSEQSKRESDVNKKFAIDLRTPDEIESDLTRNSEA